LLDPLRRAEKLFDDFRIVRFLAVVFMIFLDLLPASIA